MIDRHWNKIIICLIFVIPLIYFARFLSSDVMIGGSDYLLGDYPLEKYAKEYNGIVLWHPDIFGGTPVLGNPTGGTFAPLAQLNCFLPPQITLVIKFIFMFAFAGLGMYVYLKELGLSKYAATTGAFIYQFMGNLASTPMAGHAGRAASMAIFPLMLFFIHRTLQTKKIGYFVCFALTTAFSFYEGHFQMTYYGLLAIVMYIIYYLFIHRKEQTRKDRIKIFGGGIVSAAIIFCLMAMIWLPVIANMGNSIRGTSRGYEYAASWAMPPMEIFELFISNLFGGPGNYHGSNPFKLHTEYIGIIAIILALIALPGWKKHYVKFFCIMAGIVMLYSFGSATPIHGIFYYIIPGFKFMRAPSLTFYLASFSLITLAAMGFEKIINNKTKRTCIIATITTVLITLILQIPIMRQFLPVSPAPEQFYAADKIVKLLKRDTTIFRVLPLNYQHSNDLYFQYHNIQSAGGYIPNPIQRYQDFIGASASVMFNPTNLIQYPNLINMLNIKYVIVSNNIYCNNGVLPRAYIVSDYQTANDSNSLDILKSADFNPHQIILLSEDPGIPHSQKKSAMVIPIIKQYSPNKIVIETDCSHDGFLLLADNWHPDWRVQVDKQWIKCLRANYIFRAVYVQAGQHRVIFEYKSISFIVGLIITMITLCLIFGVYIYYLLRRLL